MHRVRPRAVAGRRDARARGRRRRTGWPPRPLAQAGSAVRSARRAAATSTALRPSPQTRHGGRRVAASRRLRRRRPRSATASQIASSRRRSIASYRIDEPRMPDDRRSATMSSAACRRQKPWSRSRPSRKPRSSTRSAMIESSIARSARARTTQIGAATLVDRGRQPDVDEVARGQASRSSAADRRSRAGRPG